MVMETLLESNYDDDENDDDENDDDMILIYMNWWHKHIIGCDEVGKRLQQCIVVDAREL